MSFPSLISQKPGEILIFRTFAANFLILAYISLTFCYFELGHDYDVTLTSYLRCCTYFGIYGKRRPLAITMVPIICIG